MSFAWLKLVLLLAKYLPWLNKWLNEHTASKRLVEKNGAVDTAINDIIALQLSKAKTEQQQTINGKNGLSNSSASSPGVGEGQPQNNKQTRI